MHIYLMGRCFPGYMILLTISEFPHKEYLVGFWDAREDVALDVGLQPYNV